jgi:uncharacterized membrane protein YgdD (TMEM256/DUF423 family)
MGNKWISWSAVVAGISVILSAISFHVLASNVDEHHVGLWNTGCRSLMYGALSLGILGLATRGSSRRIYDVAGWGIALGSLIFSLGNFGFAFMHSRFLFLLTPVGAVSWILGLFVFGWAVLRD